MLIDGVPQIRDISSRLFVRLSQVEVMRLRLNFCKVGGGESRVLIYPRLSSINM